MAKVERHMEVLAPDCEEYLATQGMFSVADHADETDPADIYTSDGELVLLQVPRDITSYYLMRLVDNGREQFAKGLRAGNGAQAAQDSSRLAYLASKARRVEYDGGWKAAFDVSVNAKNGGSEIADFREAIDAEAGFLHGFIHGQPHENLEVAWLLMFADSVVGGSHYVVLGVRDDSQWCVAADWKADSTLDSVYSEGSSIAGWLPYSMPSLTLGSASGTGTANVIDIGPAHKGIMETLSENMSDPPHKLA